MKKINYFQMLILALMFNSSAWSQEKTELTDEQKNKIRNEVNGIIHKIYYELFPAFDSRNIIACGTKDAFIIEGMYTYVLGDSNTEKIFADQYLKFSKREAKVSIIKTEVLSTNSAYSIFGLAIKDYYKDNNEPIVTQAMCTFIFTTEGNVWKIKHEHLSY